MGWAVALAITVLVFRWIALSPAKAGAALGSVLLMGLVMWPLVDMTREDMLASPYFWFVLLGPASIAFVYEVMRERPSKNVSGRAIAQEHEQQPTTSLDPWLAEAAARHRASQSMPHAPEIKPHPETTRVKRPRKLPFIRLRKR